MYVTGSDAWNSQKQMSEVRIGGQSPRELREGLPDAAKGGNQWQGLFCDPDSEISARARPEPFAYSVPAPIFGS